MDTKSHTQKAIITGSCVITEMAIAGIFMENVKMEKQRTSLPYRTITTNILKQGLRGYHIGLYPWGILTGFGKGFVLGGSRSAIIKQCDKYNINKDTANLLSGFGAGLCQGIYMSPLNLARIRINQNLTKRTLLEPNLKLNWHEELKYSTNILYNSVKNEGIGVLTTGMHVMMLKRSIDWGTRFYFIEKALEHIVVNREPAIKDKLLASFIGATMSVSIAMPIDRLMPLIQQQKNSHTSVMNLLTARIKQEGIRTLFRGWTVRILQAGWHTTFVLFVADKVYTMI